MKKTEQILKNGEITIDYDQTLSKKEIKNLMFDLFEPVIREDEKQFVLYNKIGVLACNVTYLGNPHPIYKKRIQLKQYYLDYLARNSVNNLKTVYLGIYTYKKTRLYVVFEPTTYAGKKSNNSAAHVFSINLQYAQRAGKFSKVDSFGNSIQIFNTYEFVRYIKSLASDPLGGQTGVEILNMLNERLIEFKKNIPTEWNGIECYKEMIEKHDPNARQGEWQGWYFEHLFKQYLKNNDVHEIVWHSDKSDDGVDLDVKFPKFEWTYGDLKADQINHDILGNSFESLDAVIKDNNGIVYYICCLYKAEKDSDHNYQVTRYWNTLRDEPYTSEEDIKSRYGKRMKYSVTPKKLCVLKIDSLTYELLKKNPFAQGVNSDGNERKPKLKVNKDMITALSIFSQDF